MSELTRMDSFDALHVRAHPRSSCYRPLVDGHLLGCKHAILKFKSGSVCEVIGYQLAAALGVQVPRMQGVWTPTNGVLATGLQYNAFRIGILVEELPDLKWGTKLGSLTQEELRQIGPDQVARVLAFCMFDGNEWGEFVSANDGPIYFIDLENVLGPMVPECLFDLGLRARKAIISGWKKDCDSQARLSVMSVFREANRLGVLQLVRNELARFVTLPESERARIVSISGHPLDQEISKFFAEMLEDRVSVISSFLNSR